MRLQGCFSLEHIEKMGTLKLLALRRLKVSSTLFFCLSLISSFGVRLEVTLRI